MIDSSTYGSLQKPQSTTSYSLFTICTLTLLISLTSTLTSCQDETSPPVDPSDKPSDQSFTSRTQLLEQIRSNVIIPALERFQSTARELTTSIETADLSSAQQSWQNTMLAWHALELLQIGPAGISGSRVGGEDLRDHVYSLPIVNACRVEQEWLRASFDNDDWASSAPFNIKGLDAMEAILFKEGTESRCPNEVGIILDGSWDEFSSDPDRYEEQRWAYLAVLSADLNLRAEMLLEDWQGDFGNAFITSSEPFTSQREAIDQVFAAIFYVDKFIKDLKLGGPTGIYMSCLEDTCPEQIEHLYSGIGRDALIENMHSFERVLRGGDRPAEGGFIQLLREEGADELATQLLDKTAESITQLEGLNVNLSEQLVNEPDVLREAHATIRSLTELLKSQFVTTLNLSVPQEGAGDND